MAVLLLFLSLLNVNDHKVILNRHQIISQHLGYAVDYVVSLPNAYDPQAEYPVIYMTDGPSIEKNSRFLKLAASFQEENDLPFISVLVSPIDPNSGANRRNKELLANEAYYAFFVEELVPSIRRAYAAAAEPDKTYFEGLSFGGLNALFFGLKDQGSTFGKIAVLSPAIHPRPWLLTDYKERKRLPISFFLSSGTYSDNEATTRKIRDVLESKGYDLVYNEVPHAHNMKNWDANWIPMLKCLFQEDLK